MGLGVEIIIYRENVQYGNNVIEDSGLPQDLPEVIDGDVAELNTWRDSIALAMWNAYLVELAARGIALPN